MAKSSAPNSQGSQFYIVQNDQDVSDGLAIQHYPEKSSKPIKMVARRLWTVNIPSLVK